MKRRAVVYSRQTQETQTPFDDDDAALLFAVRESLRLFGVSVQVKLGEGKTVYVWTQTV